MGGNDWNRILLMKTKYYRKERLEILNIKASTLQF